MASRSVSVDAGNVKLSGRFLPATNGQPRALLVALHGGTYSSKYFDTAPSRLLALHSATRSLRLTDPGMGQLLLFHRTNLRSMARFQS